MEYNIDKEYNLLMYQHIWDFLWLQRTELGYDIILTFDFGSDRLSMNAVYKVRCTMNTLLDMYKRLFEDWVKRNYKKIFFEEGNRSYKGSMPSYMFHPAYTEEIFVKDLTYWSLKGIISFFEDLEMKRQEGIYVGYEINEDSDYDDEWDSIEKLIITFYKLEDPKLFHKAWLNKFLTPVLSYHKGLTDDWSVPTADIIKEVIDNDGWFNKSYESFL